MALQQANSVPGSSAALQQMALQQANSVAGSSAVLQQAVTVAGSAVGLVGNIEVRQACKTLVTAIVSHLRITMLRPYGAVLFTFVIRDNIPKRVLKTFNFAGAKRTSLGLP